MQDGGNDAPSDAYNVGTHACRRPVFRYLLANSAQGLPAAVANELSAGAVCSNYAWKKQNRR